MSKLTIGASENGKFPIIQDVLGSGGKTAILLLSGTAGGAVVKLQYNDGNGYVDLSNGTLTVGSQDPVVHGGEQLYIDVSGATETTNLTLIARFKE